MTSAVWLIWRSSSKDGCRRPRRWRPRSRLLPVPPRAASPISTINWRCALLHHGYATSVEPLGGNCSARQREPGPITDTRCCEPFTTTDRCSPLPSAWSHLQPDWSLADTALCSLHHLVGAATTAAVRLMGLDPFEVQALAARLAPSLDGLATAAADVAASNAAAELPAGNSMLADILAEHHATWEVRLFAS